MRSIRIIKALAAGLVLTVMCLWIGLPVLLERAIIPRILPRIGLEGARVAVSHVGVFGMDLGPVVLPGGTSVAAVRIEYTPWGVVGKKAVAVRCAGLVLPVRVSASGVAVPGLPLPVPASSGVHSDPGPLVFPLERFELTGATLVLDLPRGTLRVPFEADVFSAGDDFARVKWAIRAWPEGREIRSAGTLELQEGEFAGTWDAPRLDPGVLLEPLTAGLPHIRGEVATSGRITGNLSALSRVTVAASVRVERLRVQKREGGPVVMLTPDAGEAPLLTLAGQGRQWSAATAGMRVSVADRVVRVEPLTVELTADPSGGAAEIRGGVRYLGGTEEGLALEAPLYVPFQGEGGWDEAGWRLGIHSLDPDRAQGVSWRIGVADGTLTLPRPDVEFRADGVGTTFAASWDVRTPSLGFLVGKARLSLADLRCSGTVQTRGDDPGTEAAMEVACGKGTATLQDLRFRFPGWSWSGTGALENGRATGRGVFQLSRAQVAHGGSEAAAAGIYLRLPMVWPPGRAVPGTVRIGSMTLGGRALGSLRGTLQQVGVGVKLDGEHRSLVLPGAVLALEGSLSGTERHGLIGEGRVALSGYELPDEFDPGTLVPALAGFRLRGTADLTGTGRLEGGRGNGRAALRIAGGTVRSRDLDLEVDGIAGEVVFPDLPHLRSSPDQVLTVDRVRLGDVVLTDVRAALQMESPQSLFLEQARFSWCEGRVFVQPLRVVPGKDAYDLVLFCDRIRLAPLLRQLGGLRARGDGAVSGRIPLSINGSSVRFDDGFLYSSPGEGGRVRISGTEIFTAGIPPESMQYAQLDLAREALKEYDYDWVKLGFHSQEDTLLMRLQFDGKPAGPLPFVYDKQFGGFARVTAGHQGSNFQGIRLDVNFRLPLDTILQYGSGAGKIFEMME